MPLALAVQTGDKILVGNKYLEVLELGDHQGVRIKYDDKEYNVFDDESVEIAPEVFVSEGYRLTLGSARLAFTAPRRIVILREDLVRGAA